MDGTTGQAASAEKTILLVEDERILGLTETRTLEREGFHVLLATSGEGAVSIVKQHRKIDLILMDIDLGEGIDGTRAAEIILREREIPVIFLSSHTETESVQKTERITSFGYVVKDSGRAVLLASIKTAFRLYNTQLALLEALKERKKAEHALRESEKRYRELFNTSIDGLVFTDMEGKYIECNPAYLSLLGYDSAEELRMKSYEELTPREYHSLERRIIEEETLARGYCDEYEKEYIRKDGTRVWVSIRAWLRKDSEGRSMGMWLVVQDVSRRKRTEAALAGALAEKEALLEELKHRIKNSLAIITGLVNLEAERPEAKEAREALFSIRDRIASLATLYDMLFRAQGGEQIRLDSYMNELCRSNISVYTPKGKTINIVKQLDEVLVGMKLAVPLGIILNELLTNSIKYAFPEGRDGLISLKLEQSPTHLFIEVHDDGIGLPEDFALSETAGFGFELVLMLIQQINGEISFTNSVGTLFRILVPHSE